MKYIFESYFDNKEELDGDDSYMGIYDSKLPGDYRFYMKFHIDINDSLYSLKMYEKESNIYLTSQKLFNLLDNLSFIDNFTDEQRLVFGWNNEWQMEMNVKPTVQKKHITDQDLSEFIDKFKSETGYDYTDSYYKKPDITTEYQIKILFNVTDKISYERFYKEINIINKSLYNINLWRKWEIGTIETQKDSNLPVYDAEIDAKSASHATYIKTLYSHLWIVNKNDLLSVRDVAYKLSNVEKVMNDYIQSSLYNVELKNIEKTSYRNYKNNTTYSVVFFDLFYTLKKHKELAKNQILSELKEKVFLKLPLYFLRDWKFCIRIKSNKNFATYDSSYNKPNISNWKDKRGGRFEEVNNNIGNSNYLTFPNFYKFYFHIDEHIKGYVMFLDLNNRFTNRYKIGYYSDESFANLVQS